MSFDVGGDFEENADPTDVSSDVNADPQSDGYGDEQITSDPANPGEQVGNESGNASFQDATNSGATDTAPAATNAGSTTQTFDDGSTITTNADGTVTATNAPGTSTLDQIQAKAGNLLDQAQGAIKKELAQISLSKIVTQAENTAINLVKQVATQTATRALSTVVGPAAAATITGSVSRGITGALSGNATTVSSSVDPNSPNFVGPPAPTNRSPAPTNDGSTTQTFDDGSTITTSADGKVTSTPAPSDTTTSAKPTNAGPTTQTFDDGSTITTNADGTVTSTPAPGSSSLDKSAKPTNAGSTTQTFDDGSTITTNADGTVTSTPAIGATDKSPTPVADPSLAQVPANANANGVNPSSINTSPGAISATAAGLTGSAIAGAVGQASIATAANAANAAVTQLANNAAALALSAQAQQTARLQFQNQAQSGDWRVKLCLAPNSNYLYNNQNDPGSLLWPLYNTNGVIFPYTPAIDTAYKANYTPYDLTHSNYRGYFYQNSYVDSINLKATFTAQDTNEANYLLAVIHFFRSVTKMFYGQDAQAGSPPPLVFLSGLGDYQFNYHPCVVSQFNYSLPADVNYIRAQNIANDGTNQLTARNRQTVLSNPLTNALQRLSSLGQGIQPGAIAAPFVPQGILPTGNPTYVPTKMDITISLLPMQSRSEVSQLFSLAGFANGNLLKGGFW